MGRNCWEENNAWFATWGYKRWNEIAAESGTR